MSHIGLGRLVAKDERDRAHVMPRRAAADVVTWRYWPNSYAFDQGNTPHCVAYAGVRYLVSGPIYNRALNYLELYNACQKIDEWPGENYEGTSVRALFKVLQARGFVSGYQWALGIEPVIDHLLVAGPVVLGTSWSDEMANLGSDGYLTLGDYKNYDSGHAWCALGANRLRKNPDGTLGAVRAINSWGTRWGPDYGRFWVSFADLGRLLEADGEACVAKEVLVKRT